MRSAFLYGILSLLVFGDGFAAIPASAAGVGGAMRRNSMMRGVNADVRNTFKSNDKAVTTIVQEINTQPNNNDKEQLSEINTQRDACLMRAGQHAGTFVWASRNSNTTSYATMVEDVENPENNTCYVKVSVQNSDERVDTHDIPSRYFAMGQNVTCGGWLDTEDLKARVLDAGKSRRVWGAVATSFVGAGAGVGVSEGAMAIAAKKGSDSQLLGQKALDGTELLISQIKELKRKNIVEYNRVMNAMQVLDETCDKEWQCDKPAECDENKNPFRKLRDKLTSSAK